MKKMIWTVLIFLSLGSAAQTDSSNWLRAFPITSYIVDLNDTIKVVQLEMPDDVVIKDRQLGLVRGLYNGSQEDTVYKGYGRCHLIKGNYYYFSIGNNKSGMALKEGDLLYTFMGKTNIYYGQVPKMAAHFIQMLSVYDEPFYDRYQVFREWSAAAEKKLVDSMVADIRFTGNYFRENSPAMDQVISKGSFRDKKVLTVMSECQASQVRDFMNYVIARPRLYAGKKWKISEVFATWAVEGAPTTKPD